MHPFVVTSGDNKFIESIEYLRDSRNCSGVLWKKIAKNRHCGACYRLDFLNVANEIISNYFTKNERFENCNDEKIIESQSVKITTFVQKLINTNKFCTPFMNLEDFSAKHESIPVKFKKVNSIGTTPTPSKSGIYI